MQVDHKFQLGFFVRIDYQAIILNNHLLRCIDKVSDLSFVKKSTKRLYGDTQDRP